MKWFTMAAVVGIVALLFGFALFSSCRVDPTDIETDERCVGIDGVGVADCMIRCSEAANPKSDEEGEDLVAQCDSSCTRMLCARRAWFYRRTDLSAPWRLCSASARAIQDECRRQGWPGQ